ncbi:hemin uptake protein hemP [Roseateles asaccharophilus]|jgi:hemin uptake protein HemP|uniref:Hemin uptake protein hemP n=1 Tax=Roseateles asaccharophilus TaxID=582607 RepID=A0A4R6MYU1_9BURK|nr:hemin uptake protein hemP [Roseateles asaccharophilus]
MSTTVHTLPRQTLAHEPGMPAASSLGLPPPQPGRRRLSSQSLMGQEREIEIEHAGQLYRLRLTSLGKLILTK